MLQRQKCVKKGLQILEVCLMVLVRGARECFFEWLWEVLAGVADVFVRGLPADCQVGGEL